MNQDFFSRGQRRRLEQGIEALAGLPADDARRAAAALERYAGLLAEANRTQNLVADAGAETLLTRHLLDAVAGFGVARRATGRKSGSAVDVGSGAGLPGVVWAAVGEFERVVCCESNRKKAAFVRETATALGLGRLEVDTRRAEELARDAQARDRYDLVTARALAALPTLIEYAAPLCCPGGFCVFFKGRGADGEIRLAEHAAETLQIRLEGRERYEIPGSTHGGELLVYLKEAPTPERFPRPGAAPRKRPL